MDCPICYESISKETGQVTTSCGHTFHFKCLNTWYYRQIQSNDSGQESCPCCRKEPGEFERASLVTESEDDEESTTISDITEPALQWIRVGERRWVITRSEEERLQTLAELAANLDKQDSLEIPPYNGEAHALWILRHLFDDDQGPAQPMEDVNPLDKPKMVRRRRRSFGRSFWSHLGEEYQLKTVDGYATD